VKKLAILAVLASTPAFAQTPDAFTSAQAQTKSGDVGTRRNGADALAKIRRPESGAILRALLASDPDAGVRQQAATSLGLLGDAGNALALIAGLKDVSAPTRFACVRSLGALRSPDATKPLSALLGDADASMRRTAGAALAHLEDPAAAGALKGALTDADEGVRLEAAAGLARLGDASASQVALDGLKSKDASARSRAASVAALAGDENALAPLDAAYAAEKNKSAKAAIDEARTVLRQHLARKKTAKPAPAAKAQ
jgi:HEAT repeat protein